MKQTFTEEPPRAIRVAQNGITVVVQVLDIGPEENTLCVAVGMAPAAAIMLGRELARIGRQMSRRGETRQ